MINYHEDWLLRKKNIYACLVKEQDLKNKNFGLKTPLVSIDREETTRLICEKYKTLDEGFLDFIKSLEEYVGVEFTSIYKAKYRYLQIFRQGKANIVFLRVISICLSKEIEESYKIFDKLVSKHGYVETENGIFPLGGLSKRIAYLTGVIAGDGHLHKGGNIISIVDGQSNREKLAFSKEYLKMISMIFREEFNIEGKISDRGTWWTYLACSKWLVRYFNFYLNIPCGNKSSKISLPPVLQGENEELFWKGVMDTDGFIDNKRKCISVKSKSKILMQQFMEFCKKNKIAVYAEEEKKVLTVRVFSDELLKFARIIGFSHPRKRDILIKHLQKGAAYKVVAKINFDTDEKTKELLNYLRPYKQGVVYIKQGLHHEKGNRLSTLSLIHEIEKRFCIKATEVKRPRLNNHFYICSEKFRLFLMHNVEYDLPWQSLNKEEIENLMKGWKI